MISGIGSIGALKPATEGAGVATDALQGIVALSQAASKTVNTLQNAEQVSIQALRGDADTRQVVDAVMSAQQALQTTIAIRDKVVSAYLEISRISI
ncbi:MAG: flagellar hook-basal body protein FliE [Mesorhizobium sp.]|nr:MAG: flagellar hook-basal body protein FliE [Mesorhizobium sp.]